MTNEIKSEVMALQEIGARRRRLEILERQLRHDALLAKIAEADGCGDPWKLVERGARKRSTVSFSSRRYG